MRDHTHTHKHTCKISEKEWSISFKIVDKKEIIHNISNTGIYCSGDKIGRVYLV
jgi:hypothetical protein